MVAYIDEARGDSLTDPIRAFLSHATSDKAFVSKVAEQLGRAAVVFDAFEFATGDDLKQAIMTGLERSQIFVLFASRAALTRDWVRLEIDEAEKALISKKISGVLTYIIDPDLSLDSLPDWMKSALITKQASPALVASDIRRVISARIAATRPKHFVGRNTEVDQALDLITSFQTPDHRPPLIVYGLSGIGRRSVIEAVARDGLSLKRMHTIRLKEGDLLPEALLKIKSSLAGGSDIIPAPFLDKYRLKIDRDIALDIAEELRAICASRAYPVLFDEGAIVNEDGALRPEYDTLYSVVTADPEIDLGIVSNRRILGGDGKALPSVRVTELSPNASQRLVRLLARDRQIQLGTEEAKVVAEYSRGYPPAVIFAVQEMEAYGPAYVAASRAALSRFSEEIFLKKLQSDKKMSMENASILQLLSTYSPLPLPVIRDYLSMDGESLVIHMTYLLDFALVVPEGVNYRISEPIRQAAYRAFNGLHLDHGKISGLLEGYLSEFEDDDTRLSLGQNLFRAATLAGRRSTSKYVVSLASDLIELAVQSYHDRDYDKAISVGELAIDARPNSVNVRRFVAQALIRRERFAEAEVHIKELMSRGYPKEAFYVRGFMARRQYNHPLAIEHYERSLGFGRSGVPIHRELAGCYFESGDLPKARAQIEIAERLSPHNKYVVDLQCQIAIRLGDLSAAERALAVLSRVEEAGFYEHRRSTFEQARGNLDEALRFARLAVDDQARPQFETLANLANCQMEMGDVDGAAATLVDIDNRFATTHRDSRLGMRTKLELKKGDLETAEVMWRKIRSPSKAHLALRSAMLRRKAQKSPLSSNESAELERLSANFKAGEDEKAAQMLGAELANIDL